MLLTNKHFIVALIVAPILAIIAYFAVDYMVSERPHSAISGKSYPLVAKSNCRYQSGQCTFKNGDVEFNLTTQSLGDNQYRIQLHSDLNLQGVKIGLVSNASSKNTTAPQTMQFNPGTKPNWSTTVPQNQLENGRLLVAVSMDDVIYYGETETTFANYQTGFSRGNITQ